MRKTALRARTRAVRVPSWICFCAAKGWSAYLNSSIPSAVLFGGEGIVAEDCCYEQRNVIKYTAERPTTLDFSQPALLDQMNGIRFRTKGESMNLRSPSSARILRSTSSVRRLRVEYEPGATTSRL